MFGALKNFFVSKQLNDLRDLVVEINTLESGIEKLNDAELKEKSLLLHQSFLEKGEMDYKQAFALAREASKRTLRQRPYDVQLMGGIVLYRGGVTEMMTGEGKTLAAVAPVYARALEGGGAHVVTVNEYLARRDAVWMGQIYRALGLSVSCLVPNAAYLYDPDYVAQKNADLTPGEAEKRVEKLDKEEDTTGNFLVQQDFLRPISRREAYLADITYGTNHEFGFDYLRDNLVYSPLERVQRKHYFAVIDEVDSILIDEARTPLIISAPDAQSSEYYKTFARLVKILQVESDYTVDEKKRAVSITPEGIEKIEKAVGVQNVYAPENLRMVHYLEESLRAHALYRKDKDYVVKNGEIVIVDEFTGRLLQGRRYNGGLHQAIEAKEGVFVKEESKTYAKISIQNYFRMYDKISGMTGTAQTSAEEFYKVYNLDVFSIPSHRPLIREDRQDVIYKDQEAKWRAVVRDVRACYERGQPVLLGTTSIEKNEHISALLREDGIPHEILNAKNNEREGSIIAQAGRLKGVTVATNMAGRGVDIILGGNPPVSEEAQKVRELGGLHVIGT
ncbi:MAG: preprotein translocase subunit SecA, partial [Candidatus Liptonbacteria bacterium]